MRLFLNTQENYVGNHIGLINEKILPLHIAQDVQVLQIDFDSDHNLYITTKNPSILKDKTIRNASK